MKILNKLFIIINLLVLQNEVVANSENQLLSKARNASDLYIISLKTQGITEENVSVFEKKIQSIITKLNKKSNEDDDGRIGDEIAVQQDLLDIVKLLLNYHKSPSKDQASKLHTLGSSYGCPVAELIESELSKISPEE